MRAAHVSDSAEADTDESSLNFQLASLVSLEQRTLQKLDAMQAEVAELRHEQEVEGRKQQAARHEQQVARREQHAMQRAIQLQQDSDDAAHHDFDGGDLLRP